METNAIAILCLAERYDWPRAKLAPAVSVGPGEHRWRQFATLASGARLQQAYAALTALPKNPAEPISPRLV